MAFGSLRVTMMPGRTEFTLRTLHSALPYCTLALHAGQRLAIKLGLFQIMPVPITTAVNGLSAT